MPDSTAVRIGPPGNLSVSQGIVRATIPFTPSGLPRDWLQVFARAPFPLDLEEPSFTGTSGLSIQVAKADLERYIQALKDRVEATNGEYDKTVVPKLKHAEEKRAAEQAAKEEEEADARRTIEDLL